MWPSPEPLEQSASEGGTRYIPRAFFAHPQALSNASRTGSSAPPLDAVSHATGRH